MSPDLVTLAQHAGVGTMGSAECVVDIDVTQLSQAFTELLDLKEQVQHHDEHHFLTIAVHRICICIEAPRHCNSAEEVGSEESVTVV